MDVNKIKNKSEKIVNRKIKKIRKDIEKEIKKASKEGHFWTEPMLAPRDNIEKIAFQAVLKDFEKNGFKVVEGTYGGLAIRSKCYSITWVSNVSILKDNKTGSIIAKGEDI